LDTASERLLVFAQDEGTESSQALKSPPMNHVKEMVVEMNEKERPSKAGSRANKDQRDQSSSIIRHDQEWYTKD
jgi:hypothetical protein